MDKSALLSIGEFSQLSRMTIKALHYYEKINLLQPAWIDPASGYRYYDANQLHFAQIIGLFTDLDIRLNHLTDELFTEYLDTNYKELLAYGRQATKEKIEELTRKMRYIDYLEEILTSQDSSITVQHDTALWLLPCYESQNDFNINTGLKKILNDLKQQHITARDNYGLIIFYTGSEKHLYYFVGIKSSFAHNDMHKNIFFLPKGEYRKIRQKEINIQNIPSLFNDLFSLTYDKIVLIVPEVSSYTISCLLPNLERSLF